MARVFDPYLIPGTNVLRNLVGATDEDALAAAENDLCSARAAILRENLPPAEGTLEQLPAYTGSSSRTCTTGRGRYEPSTWARARGFPSNRWSCSA